MCWGDSLTASHVSGKKGKIKKLLKGDTSYPGYLEEMLGDGYQVVNAGVGGENTLTIMARQGCFPMKTAHIISWNKGEKEKIIGTEDMPAFLSTYNNEVVRPLLQNGWKGIDDVSFYEMPSTANINPVFINGKKYTLSCDSKIDYFNEKFHFTYTYSMKRDAESLVDDTIPKGSVIHTYASKYLRHQYAYIFFVGENGGYKNNADLVSQLKAMIAYTGSNRYIVMSFHKPNIVTKNSAEMSSMEDTLSQVFGTHFINLRHYLVTSSLRTLTISLSLASASEG